MEFKADALLLRAVDYGEYDRMVTLLTAERGKIGAGMKGVRRAGAKLAFASSPFCFAEYVLAARGGRYTVTQAYLHDGFYDLRTDLAAFYAAAAVTEACDLFAYEGMECGALLVSAVEALGAMCGNDPRPPLVRFLLEAVALAGYPVHAEDCPSCGKKMTGIRYFDFSSGAFNCADCAIGAKASESTYLAVRAALKKGPEAPPDGNLRALRLLNTYIAFQTDSELRSLSELLRLP